MPQPTSADTVSALTDQAVWTLIGSAWRPPLRVTEVSYSYSRKLNLENYGGQRYESADVFLCMKAPVDPGENVDEIYDQLRQAVREKVSADCQGITDAIRKRERVTTPRGG